MRICKHGYDVLDSRVFFSELFYKSNRARILIILALIYWSNGALFPCLHSLTLGSLGEFSSRVCVNVLNSPNLPRVRLCKHGKSAPLLKYYIVASAIVG